MTPENGDRAATANVALEAFIEVTGDPGLEESISDLMTNLLHLAVREEIDPDKILRLVQLNFTEERDDT